MPLLGSEFGMGRGLERDLESNFADWDETMRAVFPA
jgi:hypothetical protein